MKKILILILVTLSLYSSEKTDNKNIDPELVESILAEVDSSELLKLGSSYLEVLASQENQEKVTEIQNKMKEMATKTFKTLQSKMIHFNIQEALKSTYTVKVTTKDDTTGYGTAVALSSDGKLITAYHNISSYKTIIIIDNEGKKYTPKVGNISVQNDLAYLYIDVKHIPYVKIATDVTLGEDLYLLSYEKLLLTGKVSQIKNNDILINTEAKKGTSGGGVFNESNELVSILISKDVLTKTSFSVRPSIFHSITEKFRYENKANNFNSNNYNTKYCHDENDLKIWKQNEKSSDLKVQEFHALFLGLCKKVENKNLTTDEAQYIFENTRKRLFGN